MKRHKPPNSDYQEFVQFSTWLEFSPGLHFWENNAKQTSGNEDSRVCFLDLATEVQEEHSRLRDGHDAGRRVLPLVQRHIALRRLMADFAAQLE